MGFRKFRWDVSYTAALLLCGGVWLAQQSGLLNSPSILHGVGARTPTESVDLDSSALADITEGEDSGEFAQNGNPAVVLLVAEWCGYCRAQEKALHQNRIPFKKLDIEKSDAGLSLYSKLGGGGIPITIVGDSVIRGYDPSSVISAFNKESASGASDYDASEDSTDDGFASTEA